MTTVNAEEVRIPRRVREAVTRHEKVVVLNRERAVLAIVHPDDVTPSRAGRRGRPLHEIVSLLSSIPAPDPDFATDMDAVQGKVGRAPGDPWASS